MSREIRKVPASWNHPKDDDGSYRPLYDGSFKEAAKEWDEGAEQWQRGYRDNFEGGLQKLEPDDGEPNVRGYIEWAGQPPSEDDYMPDWPEEERTHFQMYETCTEGTPISPVFATPEEVARWCADNGASAFGSQTASYEAWLRVARGGWAPSAVVGPGTGGLVSGVEGLSRIE